MFFKKITKITIFLVILIFMLLLSGLFVNASEANELIAAFTQSIQTFDVHNYRGGYDNIVQVQIYEGLVKFNKDRNIVPSLATSWEQIDNKTWEFKLRQGVKFHDGTPFNAEAVKFSIERSAQGTGKGYIGIVNEVEIVDDFTVLLHLKNEYGPILQNLASVAVLMMNPKFVEEAGESIVERACGTGPFMLQEYKRDLKVVLIKNENYWGETAKIDKLEIRTIPEEGSRVMALRSGEVDLIENPSPNDLPSIEGEKNLYVYLSPKNRTLYLGFNLKDENIGKEINKPIREAIAYAVDKQAIVDYVLDGLAIAANTGLIPQSMSKGFHDPNLVRDFDIEKAKAILKDAGIEEGREIEFSFPRGRYLRDVETAEVIQDMVSKIGIKLNMKVMEMAAYGGYRSKFQHQMYLLAWGWPGASPQILFRSIFFPGGPFDNVAIYEKAEEFIDLMDEAAKTNDFEESMALYNQAYKIIFDQVAVIPLLHYQNVWAANNKVKNLYVDEDEKIYFEEAYLELQ